MRGKAPSGLCKQAQHSGGHVLKKAFDGWQVVVLAMLVWGNLASATLPTGSNKAGKDLQTIASWMAHLNHFYPDLDLAPADPSQLNNSQVRQQLMQDLNILESIMQGGQFVPHPSLKHLACGHAACGGNGGGGKCSSCQVDKD